MMGEESLWPSIDEIIDTSEVDPVMLLRDQAENVCEISRKVVAFVEQSEENAYQLRIRRQDAVASSVIVGFVACSHTRYPIKCYGMLHSNGFIVITSYNEFKSYLKNTFYSAPCMSLLHTLIVSDRSDDFTPQNIT